LANFLLQPFDVKTISALAFEQHLKRSFTTLCAIINNNTCAADETECGLV